MDPAQFTEWQDRNANKSGYSGIGAVVASIKDDAGRSVLVYAAVVFPGSIDGRKRPRHESVEGP